MTNDKSSKILGFLWKGKQIGGQSCYKYFCTDPNALSEHYLGLPTVVGGSNEENFKHVRESSSGKVVGYEGLLILKAGIEVLVKSVLQATPTYAMSCFQLPEKMCRNLIM